MTDQQDTFLETPGKFYECSGCGDYFKASELTDVYDEETDGFFLYCKVNGCLEKYT